MSVRRASNLPFALQPSTQRYHVIRPLSSLRPTFLDPHSAVSYGSCPPYVRAPRCTLDWDIKARDEMRYSCTPIHAIERASWIRAVLLFLAEHRLTLEATDDLGTLNRGPDEWQRPLGGKIARNLVLRPIPQLGINGR
jgi:hypothetical protein